MWRRRPTPCTSTHRGTIAAPVSIGLMVLVVAGVVAFALRDERVVEDAERERVTVRTLGRDPLTGRPLDAYGRPVRPRSGWGSDDQPIRMAFVPSADQAAAAVAVDGVLDALRDSTGYAIEGAILRSYGLVVTTLTIGECEVAFLTAASYARARFATEGNDDPGDDIEAILAAVRQGHPDYPASQLAYRGAILVRNDSDLTDIAEIDSSRSVAMGNPMSGAGSILPNALFNAMGLSPRILRFDGGYPLIIGAVLEGKVDAGCIWWSPPNADEPVNDARIVARNSFPDVFEKTRILGYTSWIPNEPVVVRSALPDDVKRVLARAIDLYVTERALTEEGRRELQAVGSIIGYVPATDADYDVLIETIENAFANDPEGLADFKRVNR